jgi:hypothetical protein
VNPQQENFIGNDKHLKVLLQASQARDPALWNDFSSSMGPRFRADLRGADLQGAYLAGMKLTGARLEGARLDNADLSGADLTGSELTGTSFRDANLTGAKLKLPQARIRIVAKKPEIDVNDPEARRRRRMDNLERSAQALLKDRLSKQKAQKEQGERTKAKNSPSPFANVDPFTSNRD